MRIESVGKSNPKLLRDLNRLIPQLSTSATVLSAEELQSILDHQAITMFVAIDGSDDGERVVGLLTLVVFPLPTGTRAWIEDVVVDQELRGQGVGDALNRAAIDRALTLGAKTVDLTSRPSREAANRLYQRIGFEKRQTNVYRFNPEHN